MKDVVILLWKYFPNFPGRGTAFTLVSSTPMPQRMCLFEKQSSFVFVAALATLRFPKGTFSCISAVRGTFVEEFEKLPYQGQLYW